MSERPDDELDPVKHGAEALADPDAFGALLEEVVVNAIVAEDERRVFGRPVTIQFQEFMRPSMPPDVQRALSSADRERAWASAFGMLRSLTQPQQADGLEARAQAQMLNELLLWGLDEEPQRVMEQWLPYLHRAAISLELNTVAHFERLATLDLPICLNLRQHWLEVDDELLRPLRSPLARTLRILRVSRPIEGEHVTQFLSNPHLDRLLHLDLGDVALSAPILEQLAQPRLSSLRVLELRCRVISDALLSLLDNPIMNHVRRLHLPGALLSPDMVERLARWAASAPGRRLDIPCWTSLKDALVLPTPRALVLSRERLYPEVLAQICAFERLSSLRRLELIDSELTDVHAELLSHASNLAALERLDLRFNHISDAGAASLATSPHLQQITRLDLRHNPLSPRGVALLEARFGESVLC